MIWGQRKSRETSVRCSSIAPIRRSFVDHNTYHLVVGTHRATSIWLTFLPLSGVFWDPRRIVLTKVWRTDGLMHWRSVIQVLPFSRKSWIGSKKSGAQYGNGFSGEVSVSEISSVSRSLMVDPLKQKLVIQSDPESFSLSPTHSQQDTHMSDATHSVHKPDGLDHRQNLLLLYRNCMTSFLNLVHFL